MSLLCDILSCQRLEDFCSGFPWSGFVSCCPSGWLILWLQSDWQACGALPASCLAWDSCITILRHGPLPSHSTQSYKYDDSSSHHSSTVCTLSYPCSCANMLKEALDQSPLVICVTALGVTCYINMHVGVSGFEHRCSIFTEGWSIARLSSFL